MARHKLNLKTLIMSILTVFVFFILGILSYNSKHVWRFRENWVAKVTLDLDGALIWIPDNSVLEYGSLYFVYNEDFINYLHLQDGTRYKIELNSRYNEYLSLQDKTEGGSYYSFKVQPSYFDCYVRYSSRSYHNIISVTDLITTPNAEYELCLRPKFKEWHNEWYPSGPLSSILFSYPWNANSVYFELYYVYFVHKHPIEHGKVRTFQFRKYEKKDELFIYRSNKCPELALIFKDKEIEHIDKITQYPTIYSRPIRFKEELILQTDKGSLYKVGKPYKVRGRCYLYEWECDNYLLCIGNNTGAFDRSVIEEAVSESIEEVNKHYFQAKYKSADNISNLISN